MLGLHAITRLQKEDLNDGVDGVLRHRSYGQYIPASSFKQAIVRMPEAEFIVMPGAFYLFRSFHMNRVAESYSLWGS